MAIRGSIAPFLSTAFRNKILGAFGVTPLGPLGGVPSLALLQNVAWNPTPDSPLSDFQANICDFHGYAAVSGPTFTLVNSAAPNGLSLVASALFNSTTGGPLLPQSIRGYFLNDGTDVIIYEVWPDDLKVNIATAGDFLELTVSIPLDAQQSA